jgi:RNA polymerase sigma-70 factor (ECF subfamily)
VGSEVNVEKVGLIVDETRFQELAGEYRQELEAHCYRLLGSVEDTEDVLQETLLAAWRGLAGFQGRASFRTWLYRIATNRCLNALRAGNRRKATTLPAIDADLPQPNRPSDVVWLEPYPTARLDGFPAQDRGPEAQYESREAISLAFVTALQLLPPRQRAVLVLRDVLGFHAGEAAQILESTEESVTSALKRARASLRTRFPTAGEHEPPPPPHSPEERATVEALARAYESADVEGLVALLTHDVVITTPLAPMRYEGRDLAALLLDKSIFRPGIAYRLVATRANGQPAFGVYVRDPHAAVAHAYGMLVLTLAGSRIAAMTRFDNSMLDRFGLPRLLPD